MLWSQCCDVARSILGRPHNSGERARGVWQRELGVEEAPIDDLKPSVQVEKAKVTVVFYTHARNRAGVSGQTRRPI